MFSPFGASLEKLEGLSNGKRQLKSQRPYITFLLNFNILFVILLPT